MMPRVGTTRRRQGGFSLIEVMAALIIFSVALVAYIQSLGTTTAIQADLSSEQRAVMLAQNVIEEVKLGGELTEGELTGQFEGADAAYQWTTKIEETETLDLMEVTATISWDEGRGAKEYRLTTLMFSQEGAAQ